MNFKTDNADDGDTVGIAVDRSGSTVWLAGYWQMLKIDVASGSVTSFPTNQWAWGTLALAPNGDVIFPVAGADGNEASINRMDANTGAISTVLSSPQDLIHVMFPVALCVDASGNIYFSNSDFGGGELR